MNIEQTAELLARMQLIDNRRVEKLTISVWHELVGDLDSGLAIEAVKLHQRESTAYLTPAHVRGNVERMLRASLGDGTDEWGNRIPADPGAVAAYQRATSTRKAVEA